MTKYLFIFSILLMAFSCQQNHSSKTEDKTAKELTVQDSKSKIDSTNVQNIYITGFDDAGDWEIDETGSAYNYENGLLNFAGIEINMTNYSADKTLAEVFMDKSGVITTWDPSTFATVVTAPTVGADESKLAWTYAAMKGAF